MESDLINNNETAVSGDEISEPAPALNLYQLNQSLIENNLKPMSKYNLLKHHNIINSLHRKSKNKYYMLLFRDINYYTLFVQDSQTITSLATEVLECLNQFIIYSIEIEEINGAIEFWISEDENSQPIIGYLFPYDNGVVPFGG